MYLLVHCSISQKVEVLQAIVSSIISKGENTFSDCWHIFPCVSFVIDCQIPMLQNRVQTSSCYFGLITFNNYVIFAGYLMAEYYFLLPRLDVVLPKLIVILNRSFAVCFLPLDLAMFTCTKLQERLRCFDVTKTDRKFCLLRAVTCNIQYLWYFAIHDLFPFLVLSK